MSATNPQPSFRDVEQVQQNGIGVGEHRKGSSVVNTGNGVLTTGANPSNQTGCVPTLADRIREVEDIALTCIMMVLLVRTFFLSPSANRKLAKKIEDMMRRDLPLPSQVRQQPEAWNALLEGLRVQDTSSSVGKTSFEALSTWGDKFDAAFDSEVRAVLGECPAHRAVRRHLGRHLALLDQHWTYKAGDSQADLSACRRRVAKGWKKYTWPEWDELGDAIAGESDAALRRLLLESRETDSSRRDGNDMVPVSRFPASMRTKIWAATQPGRSKKRVAGGVADGVKMCSASDVFRWWGKKPS